MINVQIFPRQSYSWDEFARLAPLKTIALDGIVRGGPKWDENKLIVNFDHHDTVVREATMSTCMQVFFAIKGGLMSRFKSDINVWINDIDQDTSLAVWLLEHHKLFEGTQSHPVINRILSLTDKWDITGGAFPISLNDSIIKMHSWVFQPYQKLRTSGSLADANADVMRNCLESIMYRLDQLLLGQAKECELNTEYKILHTSKHDYLIVDEIGGNEARYALFSHGMNAFISKVADRKDGRHVYSIGRRSRYIHFPVIELYKLFNHVEGLSNETGWGGSDIIGGSSRQFGSKLSPQDLLTLTDNYLDDLIK